MVDYIVEFTSLKLGNTTITIGDFGTTFSLCEICWKIATKKQRYRGQNAMIRLNQLGLLSFFYIMLHVKKTFLLSRKISSLKYLVMKI